MSKDLPTYSIQCLVTASHVAPEPVFMFFRDFGKEHPVYCYFWLVRGNGLNILVDTGMGIGPGIPADYPEDLRQEHINNQYGFPSAEGDDPVSRLAEFGLTPDDIDLVILTHLHFDHAGHAALYKNAKIVVNKKGWEFAQQPTHPVFKVVTEKLLQHLRQKMANQLHLAADEEEIVPGISVIWSGGHTMCSQSVKINTVKGSMIITGDVVYLYANLEQNHPIGLGVSLYESVAALTRLKAEDAILLPGHDKEILERYPGGKIV